MESNEIELKKCLESQEYFYNNYCRKEGMPEYSEEQFAAYKKEAELRRNTMLIKTRRGNFRQDIFEQLDYIRENPITPDECFKKNK